MEALKIICTVLFILICVAIVVIVLMQDSKSEGLSSAIAGGGGSTSTYWSKNKGRSKEGMMAKATIILAVLFIVLSLILNLSVMQ
ncbi:MAG: preprotein translocase subunit SecG [Lachnospiraceae bacterium]|nr:preprotein translocase subunit SecG [Lachnospiraceae bacterium]